MGNPTDALLATLEAELEERKNFQNALVTAAQEQSRDLRKEELELIERASARMTDIELQMGPLREGARIAAESGKRTAELRQMYATARDPRAALSNVEYRSAGAYIADLYYARMGDEDAVARTELYNRVAAHQTTIDNPGLLPETIVGPIVNYVDAARPLVSAIGVEDLGTGTWAYARVTQHTQVGSQAGGEKTELPSRKMTITKTPIAAVTYGGYVNVSRQDIQRTSPGILDMVVNDLATQYAVETEHQTAVALEGAAVTGPTYPAAATALQLAQAIWGAAGMAAAATPGAGRLVIAVGTAALGTIGPIFPNVNPQNQYSTGLVAADVGSQGVQGSLSGITIVMSTQLTPSTILVFSSAAVRAFEHKYGNLQVVEPSVWGVQVGYAGDFETLVVDPAGVVEITQVP